MKKKILVAEDDKVIARLLLMELAEAGFDTVHAKDGASALEMLSTQKFDGLLSDLFMPNMDGLQLVDATLGMSLNIPIVVLSGSINSDIETQLMKKGIKHIFLKPMKDEQYEQLFSIFRFD
ncbi:MAG: response regulator [Bermanella sp.]